MIQAKEQLSCLFKSTPEPGGGVLCFLHACRIVFDEPDQEIIVPLRLRTWHNRFCRKASFGGGAGTRHGARWHPSQPTAPQFDTLIPGRRVVPYLW